MMSANAASRLLDKLGPVYDGRIVSMVACKIPNTDDMAGCISCVDIELLGILSICSRRFVRNVLLLLSDGAACWQDKGKTQKCQWRESEALYVESLISLLLRNVLRIRASTAAAHGHANFEVTAPAMETAINCSANFLAFR